jgi:hypothetical protein
MRLCALLWNFLASCYFFHSREKNTDVIGWKFSCNNIHLVAKGWRNVTPEITESSAGQQSHVWSSRQSHYSPAGLHVTMCFHNITRDVHSSCLIFCSSLCLLTDEAELAANCNNSVVNTSWCGLKLRPCLVRPNREVPILHNARFCTVAFCLYL